MPSHEDLYRELQELERRDDELYGQKQAMREIGKVAPKPIDHRMAMKRFDTEIKPVLERRRRAEQGKPITRNPLVNAWLRMTGQDKIKDVEVVEPSKGLELHGMSVEEVQKEIAAHPELYPDLIRTADPKELFKQK